VAVRSIIVAAEAIVAVLRNDVTADKFCVFCQLLFAYEYRKKSAR
jgi:hypothetical protein